jgi:hypothetical protein
MAEAKKVVQGPCVGIGKHSTHPIIIIKLTIPIIL